MAPKFIARLFACTKSPSPPERTRPNQVDEKSTYASPAEAPKVASGSETSSQPVMSAVEVKPNDQASALAKTMPGGIEPVIVPVPVADEPKPKVIASPPVGKPSLVIRAGPLPKPAKQQTNIPDQHRRRDIGVRTYNPMYNQVSDPYYGFVPMASTGGACAGAPPTSHHHHHSSSGTGSGSACGSGSGGGSSCGGGSSSCGSSSSCGGGGSSCGSS